MRILYADGELDLRGPPSVIFNAFTRFARYRDWTPMIHVDQQWLTVRQGGVGSQFLLWEKPGDRHVQHYGVVTELERERLHRALPSTKRGSWSSKSCAPRSIRSSASFRRNRSRRPR